MEHQNIQKEWSSWILQIGKYLFINEKYTNNFTVEWIINIRTAVTGLMRVKKLTAVYHYHAQFLLF